MLPAALTLGLAALGVYVAELVYTAQVRMAQTALTTFAVLCGLLLIPLVAPPGSILTGGAHPDGDWRPMLMALGFLAGWVMLLAIAPLRTFFDLSSLAMGNYALLAAAALSWGLLLLRIWRIRLLERCLGVNWPT